MPMSPSPYGVIKPYIKEKTKSSLFCRRYVRIYVLYEIARISIKIPVKIILSGPIKPAKFRIMARRRSGDKALTHASTFSLDVFKETSKTFKTYFEN